MCHIASGVSGGNKQRCRVASGASGKVKQNELCSHAGIRRINLYTEASSLLEKYFQKSLKHDVCMIMILEKLFKLI